MECIRDFKFGIMIHHYRFNSKDYPLKVNDINYNVRSGPTGIFKIYISENNIFSVIRGYFCVHISKISGWLRSPVIISIYAYSVTTVRRFCRLPWKFHARALFIYLLHLCRATELHTYIPVHANFSESVKVQM